MATVLILPGLGNSDAEHWQSLWEAAHPEYRRVHQNNWDNPVMADWVTRLEKAVRATETPVVLVAHSLACLMVAQWSTESNLPVRGALLVAPPDPTNALFPECICGFETVSNAHLRFSSIVIASSNDPYGSLEYQAQCARNWGSRFINAGARGHLNGASGLGAWPEAHALLEDLICSA